MYLDFSSDSWLYCVIKPKLLFCPWLLNEGVGGKFYFLSLHKTLCFCLRHDGLFVGVNVLEVYLWHVHSMPLTHSPCVSLYHWPHRAKCYAAVTNNCWARRWRHRVSWCVSIPMSQKCYVSECHNPCHEVWHCVSSVIIVTLKHYTLLQLSARIRALVITLKISTHFRVLTKNSQRSQCILGISLYF